MEHAPLPVTLAALCLAGAATSLEPEPTRFVTGGAASLGASSSPLGTSRARRDEPLVSRHYSHVDQRGLVAAERSSQFLEACFEAFAELLGHEPRLIGDERLIVELFDAPEPWAQRAAAIGVVPERLREQHGFDLDSGRVLLLTQPSESRTRIDLVNAAFRQFHAATKKKNERLADTWYVNGLAGFLSMHRWDGERLELGAGSLLCDPDLPAIALRYVDARPANATVLTNSMLRHDPLAWAFTGYLLRAADEDDRRRFEKLALGRTGSMVAGDDMGRALGDPIAIGRGVDAWVRSIQLPFVRVAGEFEEIGAGRLAGRSSGQVAARAQPKTRAARLSTRVELDADSVAGIFVEDLRTRSTVYVLVTAGRLVVRRDDARGSRLLPDFLSVRGAGTRNDLAVEFGGGRVTIHVAGRPIGGVETACDRMGLIVELGEARFSKLEWGE